MFRMLNKSEVLLALQTNLPGFKDLSKKKQNEIIDELQENFNSVDWFKIIAGYAEQRMNEAKKK